MALICKLLVNGTHPSAIPANIQTMVTTISGGEVEELPSINFIRQSRVVLQTLNTTLAAFCLGKAAEWEQMFTDVTS